MGTVGGNEKSINLRGNGHLVSLVVLHVFLMSYLPLARNDFGESD